MHETDGTSPTTRGNHGAHHARIVRFLRENAVEAVVVNHMGEGMQRVMAKMGIALLPATPGDACASILAAADVARG